MSRTEVPPGTAKAVRVAAGDLVRVIDVEGGQVGDVFAFADSGPALAEHHSAAHTRAANDRLFPALGESFVTDRRRPILTLVEDTSPGEHDMLIPACDPARYAALGAPGHRSCATNLREALSETGLSFTGPTPQPINVFMRIPVDANGRLSWLTATSRPGDAVTLRAELDCVVVVSACPQDLVGISDAGLSPLAIETVHNGGTRS
ncbi:urea carboxylase-associated family protein [Amycolatopsis sp. NPDC089917]|uniref:urea carboxylase-associated family protein n=1 Tax=Amycolatopsis sp. NPDC089917 TaxID=3155187 RepID=UPI003434A754